MKVHMNIASGYKRSELNDWFFGDNSANVDPDARIAAVTAWISKRYGAWLTQQNIADFTITDVTVDSFRIDFLHYTDALEFVTLLGGRVVEE